MRDARSPARNPKKNGPAVGRGTWRYFALQEYRENFQGTAAKAGFALGIALELLVFRLTARTFGSHIEALEGIHGDYFQFVVLGEIAVLLPAACTHVFLQGAREGKASGLLEHYCTLPGPAHRPFLYLAAGAFLRAGGQLLLLLTLAAALFGFRLPLWQALWLLALQALVLPGFASLGLIAAAAFLHWGRGTGLFDLSLRAGLVFSGVYFPTAVYPPWLASAGIWLSPFSALVEASRWSPGAGAVPVAALLSLLLWVGASILGARAALALSFRAFRRRGSFDVDFAAP